ncbi:MAG: hypothetical protein RLZZ262_76 [Bacteroidota bacterium]|jgi:hypothetical protein
MNNGFRPVQFVFHLALGSMNEDKVQLLEIAQHLTTCIPIYCYGPVNGWILHWISAFERQIGYVEDKDSSVALITV